MPEVRRVEKFAEILAQRGRERGHAGAGLDENLRPSRRDDPAADDNGGLPAEFEKYRQMTHGYAARNRIVERAPRRRDRRA